MKYIFRIFLFLFILITGFIAIAIYQTFYKPLPGYSSTIKADGLGSAVDIHWDPFGMPHIYAENEEDLFYAVGYVHAQDRLWQMTLSQIMLEGRFAEFLGEDLIEFDRHQRTIGLWRTAKKIEQEAPEELIQKLEWYAKGVNEFIRQNKRSLPPEFTLLDIEPFEWTPAHSIGISRLIAWDQNFHWLNKMTFAYLSEVVSPAIFRELIPHYDSTKPTSLNEQDSGRLAGNAIKMVDTELALREFLQVSGSNRGSNGWAVRGSRTESGYPILAGDPHMGFSIPGNWYELKLSSPDLKITGATIPGAPFVVLGQNNNIAWSITNSMADDTDFYIEAINPDDSNYYVADSSNGEAVYQAFTWQDEVIRVKNGDDKLIRIPHTQNGPVISQLDEKQPFVGNEIITMRWSGHEVSHELLTMYEMNKARNIDQFRDSFRHYGTPVMTFVYADRDDNIALITAGNIPVRNHDPIQFQKGWDPEYNWQGFIPFDELPQVLNPENGYVATANNKLHTDNYPHYIGTFWAPSSRIERITELLGQKFSIDSADMKEMQNDVKSMHAEEITEIILPILREVQEENEFDLALSYLENWDFHYTSSSTAASIFDQFFMTLSRKILLQYMDEITYNRLVSLEQNPVIIVGNILKDSSSSFNIPTEEGAEIRSRIFRESMNETIDWLTDNFGPEPFQWRWESLHTLTLRPPLLGEAARDPEAPGVLRSIVNNVFNKGPYPVTGNGLTINNTEYSWHDPYEMILGASIRRIVDFSSTSRSQTILPTGQSGNPFSAHYGDQTNLWLDGNYRYVYHDSTFFRESNYQTMKLVPAR